MTSFGEIVKNRALGLGFRVLGSWAEGEEGGST